MWLTWNRPALASRNHPVHELDPCVLLVLAAAAMAAYPLNDAMMVKIETDLKERRGEIEP